MCVCEGGWGGGVIGYSGTLFCLSVNFLQDCGHDFCVYCRKCVFIDFLCHRVARISTNISLVSFLYEFDTNGIGK